MKTLFGELSLQRSYWLCRRCQHTEIPLDELLEIQELPNRMTKRCMIDVAYYGQNQSSFKAASELIKKAMGIDVSQETAREVTERIGREIFEADTQRARQSIENMENLEIAEHPKKVTLYLMLDGSMVNTLLKDESGSTWRENKTVIAFTDKDLIRRKDGTHIITRKTYATYLGNAEEFKKYVWDVAVQNGYGQVEKVVLIADGATWIRNMCMELFPDAVQILDLFHLKENVYTYAKHKFNHDASKYVPWAETVNAELESGKIDEVLSKLPKNEKVPTGVVNLRTYLEHNREKTNYPEYRKNGFFVGSGAIESANKTIVQRRLKQSGMRWSTSGAQYVLTLRAKVESGLWEKETRRFCA
jgi:hypothetical protein